MFFWTLVKTQICQLSSHLSTGASVPCFHSCYMQFTGPSIRWKTQVKLLYEVSPNHTLLCNNPTICIKMFISSLLVSKPRTRITFVFPCVVLSINSSLLIHKFSYQKHEFFKFFHNWTKWILLSRLSTQATQNKQKLLLRGESMVSKHYT